MKIATWNVNGIRARQSAGAGVDRARAAGRGLPAGDQGLADAGAGGALRAGGLLVLLARRRAYSGVGLHVRKERFPSEPTFAHPAFDHENRIVDGGGRRPASFASIYVPNGGKDFPAKMRFLEALDRYVARGARARARRWCSAAT